MKLNTLHCILPLALSTLHCTLYPSKAHETLPNQSTPPGNQQLRELHVSPRAAQSPRQSFRNRGFRHSRPHSLRSPLRGQSSRGSHSRRERLVFIGTCSVTTTLVSAFTKSDKNVSSPYTSLASLAGDWQKSTKAGRSEASDCGGGRLRGSRWQSNLRGVNTHT